MVGRTAGHQYFSVSRLGLRILVLSNLYPPYHLGGYGIICHRICCLLAERGHDILVVTSDPIDLVRSDTNAPEYTEFPSGLKVERALRWVSADNPIQLIARTWANRRTIRKAVQRWNPELVYSFGVDGIGFDTYDALTSLGIPDVTLVGDTWLAQAWRDLARFDPWVAFASGRGTSSAIRMIKTSVATVAARMAGLLQGRQPRRMGTVQCISQFLLDDLCTAGVPITSDSCVIPCHLTSEFFSPSGEPLGRVGARTETLRAIFVGRMELLKGPDTAIMGVAQACNEGADVTLTLIGLQSEHLRDSLENMASALGIAKRVQWEEAPDTTSLIWHLRRHDVLLFPSRIAEGFGQVNIEAMACGLPVVGTGIGGSGELILDGTTGLRFPPGDAAMLAAHLKTLATNPALLEQLADGALKAAHRYHPDPIMDRIEAVLTTVACVARPSVRPRELT